MKKIGIICEYNPFHNGHIYHLNQIKAMFPQSFIVLVMSSSFTERGDISILNKWEKTSIALDYGVDLVIELPFIYASQSADIFSYGAIAILKELKVDTIVFGTETNNSDKLKKLAMTQINNPDYDKKVKEYLSQGINYPTATSKAVKDITDEEIIFPNDLLGLSYTKEIIKQKANIEIVTIKRNNNFNDKELKGDIVSSTAIRANLKNKLIKNYIPKETYNYLKKKKENNNYFNFLKYKILTEQENINKYQTVDEGIENRILKYIDNSNNLDELILKIKTKRYTYNKLHRMFTHILCGLSKEEAHDLELKYIRVLGFNKEGKKYLNTIKKEINIPIITNYNQKNASLLELETKVDKIYSLIMESENNYRQQPIQK